MKRLLLALALLWATPALAGPMIFSTNTELSQIGSLTCPDDQLIYRSGGEWTCADTISSAEFGGFTASRAIASDASGNLVESAVTATQLGYLSDVTEPIGAALAAKADVITDPNANKIRLWDDADGAEVFATIGSGLTYTTSTHTLTASGGSGETVNVLTADSSLVSGGTYLYNGGGAGTLTLPTSSAGGGPISVRNNTTLKVTLVPNVATDYLETAAGTNATQGHKIECTGKTCWGRLYSLSGQWLWMGLGGTWSDGGAATAAGFSSSPTSKAFGSVTVDSSSAEQSFTITNSGTADLTVTAVSIASGDSTQFTAGSQDCTTHGGDGVLHPSDTCLAAATFSPTATGAKTSALRFATTELGNQDVALTGTGAGATTWLWECGWETGSGTTNTTPVDPEDYWNSATAGTISVSSTYYWKGTQSLQFAWGGASGYAVANNAGVNWGRSGTTYLYGGVRVGSGFSVDHYNTALIGLYGSLAMQDPRVRVVVFRDGSTDRLGAIAAGAGDVVSGGDTHHNWPALTTGSWYQFEVYWDNALNKAGFRAWNSAGTLVYPTSGTWAEVTGTTSSYSVETIQAGNNSGVTATIQLDHVLLSDAAVGAQ